MFGFCKWINKMLDELIVEGIMFFEFDQECFYSLVGLDIGVLLLEEIVLFVLVEIWVYFSGWQGGFLKYWLGIIYEWG